MPETVNKDETNNFTITESAECIYT